MKSLVIKSDVCLLKKSSNWNVSINDVSIDDLIKKNLPEEIKDHKDYPVKVDIKIEFLGGDSLNITTEGYEIKMDDETEESEDTI